MKLLVGLPTIGICTTLFFNKRLTGLRSLSYENDERSTVLGLERLELRRIYADFTMCYKIAWSY